MRQKPHEYMINLWNTAQNYGTACVFRTMDKEAWLDQIREIKSRYKLTQGMCRIVNREGLTIWSYCTNESGRTAMQDFEFLIKPLSVRMGWPKEVD